MTKKRRSDQSEVSGNLEEIVAAIFFSKRYTGQFGDSEEGDDIDIAVDSVGPQTPSGSGDDWTVHDFTESKD